MSAAVSVPRRLPLVTSSSLRAFRSCPRMYQYRYELAVRPTRESEAVKFGKLFHHALEWWWRLGTAPVEQRLQEALSAIADHRSGADEFDIVRAEELILGYTARWGGEQLEVLAVEAEFDGPIVNPDSGAESRTFRLGGKIDAIAKMPDGRVVVVEHKTSSENVDMGADYWKRLRLDAQISTYMVGARALGFEPAEVLYDVVKKPAIRPLKATPEESRKYKANGELYANQRAADETPEEFRARLREDIAGAPERYFSRGVVVRFENEENEAAYDVWSHSRAIRESQLSGRWPRNVDSCVKFGMTCAYWPVCGGEASLEDPSMYRRADTAHEELST